MKKRVNILRCHGSCYDYSKITQRFSDTNQKHFHREIDEQSDNGYIFSVLITATCLLLLDMIDKYRRKPKPTENGVDGNFEITEIENNIVNPTQLAEQIVNFLNEKNMSEAGVHTIVSFLIKIGNSAKQVLDKMTPNQLDQLRKIVREYEMNYFVIIQNAISNESQSTDSNRRNARFNFMLMILNMECQLVEESTGRAVEIQIVDENINKQPGQHVVSPLKIESERSEKEREDARNALIDKNRVKENLAFGSSSSRRLLEKPGTRARTSKNGTAGFKRPQTVKISRSAPENLS